MFLGWIIHGVRTYLYVGMCTEQTLCGQEEMLLWLLESTTLLFLHYGKLDAPCF